MERKNLILVVDDEPKLSTMIADYLEAVGFAVETASTGKAALECIEGVMPDLVVMDVMMPGLDGFDVVRRIRSGSDLPVILLTARASENDKLIGLELGADDYITKPFSMKELAARIRTVLRRTTGRGTDSNTGQAALQVGDLVLDREKRTVHRNGMPVSLTGAQFDILAHMMEYPGKVFTRMQLQEVVQDHAFQGYERTIDVHIKNLRKGIESDPSRPSHILTVWGVGYKFAEEGPAE